MPTRRQCANAIRALAIDAIEKSRSGHPGAPLGMADMAEALWRHGFKHNPANPGWPDRDRFVLSNGHASMLQYAVLHLTGYDFPIEEIKNFRQWGSQTPGHPERGLPPGVEMTTGPLGQGISSAVGMALAERMLAARFNTPEQNRGGPPYLCLLRRRLPDGRRLARGLLPGRDLGPGQAHCALRLQRHFH